jgi:dGTPase
MSTPLYGTGDTEREFDEGREPVPYRSDYVRDYGRVIHSASFRRLQGKTQVFPGHESDFFRNRLTHSLEVAQIAEGIAARLNYENTFFKANKINERLCATAALLHDLGHPPFGHNGERALDDQMRGHGGFEGNAQTLRIVSRLEKKVQSPEGQYFGLNLTLRTLAAILKYDKEIPLSHPEAKLVKGYYQSEADLVKRLKAKVSGSKGSKMKEWKTLECSIMDLADDIAYSTFDLEDALKAGFLTPLGILSSPDDLLGVIAEKVANTLKYELSQPITPATITAVFAEIFSGIVELKPNVDTSESGLLELAVEGYRSSCNMTGGALRTALSSQLVKDAISAVEVDDNKSFPMLSKVRLGKKARLKVEVLKQYVYYATIYSSRVKLSEFRGYEVVKSIFEALAGENGFLLMPDDVREQYGAAKGRPNERMRVVCDFVAGMTDRYAIEFYGRLHTDSAQSMFKPI